MKKTIPASECFVIRFFSRYPGRMQLVAVFHGHMCVAVVHEEFGAEGHDALIAKFGPKGATLRMFEESMCLYPNQINEMLALPNEETEFTWSY